MSEILDPDGFNFDDLALELYDWQKSECGVYRAFLDALGKLNHIPSVPEDIPLLPVSAFKTNDVMTGEFVPEAIYLSSATTGGIPSKHLVKNQSWYLDIARRCFEFNYGSVSQYAFFALLPSYLERSDSSLVKMVDSFIEISDYDRSGFFLDDFNALAAELKRIKGQNIQAIFLGVSYALLDFAELFPLSLDGVIVMETGGMKGRKKEMAREELHRQLCSNFNVELIHSEYGMTELLSQAYSHGKGVFNGSPTLKPFCKQITDPLHPETQGRSGLMGFIDLANLDSCSFLLTEDLGRKVDDDHFEILGRSDNSDIRGCNLMVSDL